MNAVWELLDAIQMVAKKECIFHLGHQRKEMDIETFGTVFADCHESNRDGKEMDFTRNTSPERWSKEGHSRHTHFCTCLNVF